MKIRLATPDLQLDSIVDGEGIRCVLWTQGCLHNCYGCHNPETHSFTSGYLVDTEAIKEQILKASEYHDGITLSGGDPMCQIEALFDITNFCKEHNINVWCYTGYTFEELIEKAKKNKKIISVLHNIDVLVDGKFVMEKKSYDVEFRGSTNQRIIDVKESLKENKAIEVKKYSDKEEFDKLVKPKYIFV